MRIVFGALLVIGLIAEPALGAPNWSGPSGTSECKETDSGSACYNCISRTCGEKHGSGGYGGNTGYTRCIDEGLNACDKQFPVNSGKPSGSGPSGGKVAPVPAGAEVKGVSSKDRKKFIDGLKSRQATKASAPQAAK